MKEKGFALLSLLITVIILIILILTGFFSYGYFKDYKTGKEIKKSSTEEAQRVQEREAERVKNMNKQIEELNQ